MAGLTLDSASLIAADRDDRRFWILWKEALRRGAGVTAPAVAVAQAWRGGRNARMAQILGACVIEPLTESRAREDWLELFASTQPAGQRRRREAVAERTAVLAFLRGALLDLLATGDRDRIGRAVASTLGVWTHPERA